MLAKYTTCTHGNVIIKFITYADASRLGCLKVIIYIRSSFNLVFLKIFNLVGYPKSNHKLCFLSIVKMLFSIIIVIVNEFVSKSVKSEKWYS